jgi:hypothetical protein
MNSRQIGNQERRKIPFGNISAYASGEESSITLHLVPACTYSQPSNLKDDRGHAAEKYIVFGRLNWYFMVHRYDP